MRLYGGWRADQCENKSPGNPHGKRKEEKTVTQTIHVIGAGLAGAEAAWQAANQGIDVIVH
ncbi:MAG TPA: hypothetical protein DEA44_00465, partial [Firmicutes bacterium]|nr:hypothetical protein [Bacillota bacterium]